MVFIGTNIFDSYLQKYLLLAKKEGLILQSSEHINYKSSNLYLNTIKYDNKDNWIFNVRIIIKRDHKYNFILKILFVIIVKIIL